MHVTLDFSLVREGWRVGEGFGERVAAVREKVSAVGLLQISVFKKSGCHAKMQAGPGRETAPRLFALLRNGAALLRRGATYKGW